MSHIISHSSHGLGPHHKSKLPFYCLFVLDQKGACKVTAPMGHITKALKSVLDRWPPLVVVTNMDIINILSLSILVLSVEICTVSEAHNELKSIQLQHSVFNKKKRLWLDILEPRGQKDMLHLENTSVCSILHIVF